MPIGKTMVNSESPRIRGPKLFQDESMRIVFLAIAATMTLGCSGESEHNGRIVFGVTDDSPGFVMPAPKGAVRIGTKFGRLG